MSSAVDARVLGALPREAARRWPHEEALVFRELRSSFAALDRAIDASARALLEAGVGPGERVALWLPNRPSWLHVFYGALRIGAIVVPLNTRLRAHDLAYVLGHCDPSVLLAADRSGPVDYLEILLDLLPELRSAPLAQRPSQRFPGLRHVVVDGERCPPGAERWSTRLARGQSVPSVELSRRERDVDPAAAALIMYTSGSTGDPKGVVHCHNLARNVADQSRRLAVTRRDTILMYLPLFHAFGMYEGALMMPLTGARMVLQEHFEPEEALRLLEAERCTLLHGFDTHFADLLASPGLGSTDTSSLRSGILAAGMASTEPVARETQRRLCPTVSGWGMTEVGVGVTLGFLDDDEDHRCLGSGHPMPGYELRVVDPDTGRELPTGQPGELRVRGYMRMLGYYDDPAATAAALDEKGWFRTGDRVEFWADGTMRFLGRIKEMLKVGGENLDPFEVEAFLQRLAEVAQVQVVGAADPRLSEVPVAIVVPATGASPDEAALIAACRGQLASFKIPRRVFFVKELPVTSSGKIQRFRLREQVAEWIGAAGS